MVPPFLPRRGQRWFKVTFVEKQLTRMWKNQDSAFVALIIRIIAFVTIIAVIQLKPVLWMIATKHHIIEHNHLLQSPLSIKWRVRDILTLNTTIKWQMKSTVFHQLNISHISFSQADIPRLPKITYGIRLKGSSFLKTASFSLNFLRSRYERAFTQREKKKKSEVLERWKKVWIQPGHCHLSTSVLFKGVFAFKNVSKPSSSLPAIFIPDL